MSLIHTPKPLAQVVTRRHPLAIASYFFTLVLGFVFLIHWYGTKVDEHLLFHGTPEFVIWSWKLELFIGSAAALFGVLMRPRITPHWPDIADLLHTEAIGAAFSGFGLTTYLVVILHLTGFEHAGPSAVIFVPLIVGRFWRATQALIEARALEALAQTLFDKEDSES
jgi:hypothetical protein